MYEDQATIKSNNYGSLFSKALYFFCYSFKFSYEISILY